MLTTPNREVPRDSNLLNGYYKKWHQKRLELKEKVTEKINDSFSGISPRSLALQRADKISSTTPLAMANSRKQTFFKSTATTETTSRPLTSMGQYQSKARPNATQDVEPANTKGRFEDMLNTYFSSLSNKVMATSPSKEIGVHKKRAEVKEIIQGRKPTPENIEAKSTLSKSPILKFKEQYDYMKKTNNGVSATALGTPLVISKTQIVAPKTSRTTVVPVSMQRSTSKAGLTIKYLLIPPYRQ